MNLYIFLINNYIYILKVMPNSAELKCAYNPIGYINSLQCFKTVENQSAEGAGGLGITRDNKLGESE